MPVSTTSAARSPSTMPTFGTSGTRLSAITCTPSATATGSPCTNGLSVTSGRVLMPCSNLIGVQIP
jgi:hypothetical protein